MSRVSRSKESSASRSRWHQNRSVNTSRIVSFFWSKSDSWLLIFMKTWDVAMVYSFHEYGGGWYVLIQRSVRRTYQDERILRYSSRRKGWFVKSRASIIYLSSMNAFSRRNWSRTFPASINREIPLQYAVRASNTRDWNCAWRSVEEETIVISSVQILFHSMFFIWDNEKY